MTETTNIDNHQTMIEAIAAIAVVWLAVSNVYLAYIVYQTKLLEKSKDIAEYKKATDTKPKTIQREDPIEVPLY